MGTTYDTVPEVSSLDVNKIKDFTRSYPCELRLLRLKGYPVRLEFKAPSNYYQGYVEAKSTVSIDFSAFEAIFKKLTDAFYDTAYVYGFLDGSKFTVYDVYVNDNYMSTRDMAILESFGLPIEKPLAEGMFTVEELKEKLNEFGADDPQNLYVLPSMYLHDKREEAPATIKTYMAYNTKYKPIVSVAKTTPNTAPSTPNITPGTTPSTVPVTNSPADDVDDEEIDYTNWKSVMSFIKLISSKEERTNVYKEMVKNVDKYVNDNAASLTKGDLDWYKKYGKKAIYFLAVQSLPETRSILFDYLEEYGYSMSALSEEENWAENIAFYISGAGIHDGMFIGDAVPIHNILKEEIKELIGFYKKEYLKEITDLAWTDRNFVY